MQAVNGAQTNERPIDPLVKVLTGGKYKSIHFVDIENLVGMGKFDYYQAKAACDGYVKCVACHPDDLFIISAGPQNASAIYSGWKLGKKILQFRKGENGADESLKALFEQFNNLEVFEHVYLGSGDHGLEPIAKKSKEHGLPLTVVTGRGAMSHQLAKYEHVQMELSSNE
jgi:hypothetical protein